MASVFDYMSMLDRLSDEITDKHCSNIENRYFYDLGEQHNVCREMLGLSLSMRAHVRILVTLGKLDWNYEQVIKSDGGFYEELGPARVKEITSFQYYDTGVLDEVTRKVGNIIHDALIATEMHTRVEQRKLAESVRESLNELRTYHLKFMDDWLEECGRLPQ